MTGSFIQGSPQARSVRFGLGPWVNYPAMASMNAAQERQRREWEEEDQADSTRTRRSHFEPEALESQTGRGYFRPEAPRERARRAQAQAHWEKSQAQILTDALVIERQRCDAINKERKARFDAEMADYQARREAIQAMPFLKRMVAKAGGLFSRPPQYQPVSDCWIPVDKVRERSNRLLFDRYLDELSKKQIVEVRGDEMRIHRTKALQYLRDR